MRISDWSSDVCSSDLLERLEAGERVGAAAVGQDDRRIRREIGRRQRIDARAEEQIAAEERIGRRVEIDRREDVGADDVGRETLAVLRIVGARGEGQPVADLERSEEHTSELQSLMRISYAVFCLKKKKR